MITKNPQFNGENFTTAQIRLECTFGVISAHL